MTKTMKIFYDLRQMNIPCTLETLDDVFFKELNQTKVELMRDLFKASKTPAFTGKSSEELIVTMAHTLGIPFDKEV